MPNPVVVEVHRGSVIEARHRGALSVVEPAGPVVGQIGDPSQLTTTRSTIKAVQALELVSSGAAARFSLSPRELAVVCASHSAEHMHTQTVSQLLARAGLDTDALQCGPHRPIHGPTADAQIRAGHQPTALDNNCSGKHTGMLLTCLHRGWPLASYLDITHPLQVQILTNLRELAGDPTIDVAGRDGCSAPTFGVSLHSLARIAAHLAAPTGGRAHAIQTLTAAMLQHPEMIGGTGRFDTDLMRVARGKLVCKIGAESSYLVAVFPGDAAPKGLGLAFKIEDGGQRALAPWVVSVLHKLGVLQKQQVDQLHTHAAPKRLNCRDVEVGEVRVVDDVVTAMTRSRRTSTG